MSRATRDLQNRRQLSSVRDELSGQQQVSKGNRKQ